MSLRILMVGDDAAHLQHEKELLRKKDWYVYTCESFELMDDMINEVLPDVLYINPKVADAFTAACYSKLLEEERYVQFPIVYTLSIGDIYLVNPRRHNTDGHRYIICNDNCDAILTAMTRVSANKVDRFVPRTHTGLKVPAGIAAT